MGLNFSLLQCVTLELELLDPDTELSDCRVAILIVKLLEKLGLSFVDFQADLRLDFVHQFIKVDGWLLRIGRWLQRVVFDLKRVFVFVSTTFGGGGFVSQGRLSLSWIHSGRRILLLICGASGHLYLDHRTFERRVCRWSFLAIVA